MTENNTVLVLAVLAVIASLAAAGFSYYSLSESPKVLGFATSTGTANLTVDSSLEINFTDASINWGAGKVDTNKGFAILDSEGTVFQGNWTQQNNALGLDNIGNINVSLHLKSGKTAATFIGGNNPSYKWKVTNNGPGSCSGASGAFGSYVDVNTTGIGTLFCNQFGYQNNVNSIYVDINITVPYDSQLGALSDVITATASTAI